MTDGWDKRKIQETHCYEMEAWYDDGDFEFFECASDLAEAKALAEEWLTEDPECESVTALATTYYHKWVAGHWDKYAEKLLGYKQWVEGYWDHMCDTQHGDGIEFKRSEFNLHKSSV